MPLRTTTLVRSGCSSACTINIHPLPPFSRFSFRLPSNSISTIVTYPHCPASPQSSHGEIPLNNLINLKIYINLNKKCKFKVFHNSQLYPFLPYSRLHLWVLSNNLLRKPPNSSTLSEASTSFANVPFNSKRRACIKMPCIH